MARSIFGVVPMKTCTIVWPNVWTSVGKAMSGEQVSLPDDEVKALADQGAVTVKKARKAKSDEK